MQSQRIIEWLKLEETSGDHLLQPPDQAGSPSASHARTHYFTFQMLHFFPSEIFSVKEEKRKSMIPARTLTDRTRLAPRMGEFPFPTMIKSIHMIFGLIPFQVTVTNFRNKAVLYLHYNIFTITSILIVLIKFVYASE